MSCPIRTISSLTCSPKPVSARTYDWNDGEIDCQRYEVTAYAEH